MRKIGLVMAGAFGLLVAASCSEVATRTNKPVAPTGPRLSLGDQNGGGLTGAIFTTDNTCTGVDFNTQYLAKTDVYLNGGPQNNPNAAGLPEGDY
jgi:hypothetical protein